MIEEREALLVRGEGICWCEWKGYRRSLTVAALSCWAAG